MVDDCFLEGYYFWCWCDDYGVDCGFEIDVMVVGVVVMCWCLIGVYDCVDVCYRLVLVWLLVFWDICGYCGGICGCWGDGGVV